MLLSLLIGQQIRVGTRKYQTKISRNDWQVSERNWGQKDSWRKAFRRGRKT